MLIHGEPDGVPQDQRRLRQLILLRRPTSTTSTTNWRRRSTSCAAPVIKSIHKSELDWWSMNSSPDCERENRSTAPCKMTSACKDHARSTTCKMIIGTGLHRRLDGSPSSTSTTLHSLPPWLHSPTAWAHRRKSRLDQKLDTCLGDTPSRSQRSRAEISTAGTRTCKPTTNV